MHCVTTLGGIQPSYVPWSGLFEQIAHADIFLFADELPFAHRSLRNRNRIKTPEGPRWLTVPVKRFAIGTPVCEVRIDESTDWRARHSAMLDHNYRRSPFFEPVSGLLRTLYNRRYSSIADLSIAFTVAIADIVGIPTRIAISSEINLEHELKLHLGKENRTPGNRILFYLDYFGADTFYEGASGRGYVDCDTVSKAGKKVLFQKYTCIPYRQNFGPFIPYLSVIDLLFNDLPHAKEIITGGTRTIP